MMVARTSGVSSGAPSTCHHALIGPVNGSKDNRSEQRFSCGVVLNQVVLKVEGMDGSLRKC